MLLLNTKDENAGYAVQETEQPLQSSVFKFAVKRAAGKGRHGNAFFVCGSSADPKNWIECRLYYGGRSSLMITGGAVEHTEEKVVFDRQGVFIVTVSVDCKARTVAFEAAGHKLTSRITGSIDAITHYGTGGANSDNVFTGISVAASR